MRENSARGWSGEFLRRLERLRIRVPRPATAPLEGEDPSRRRGSSPEILGARPYTQGDDPRYIDWALYARSGELYVREPSRDEALALDLVVDTSASMRCGRPSKILRAVELAVLLGFVGLQSRARVRMLLPAADTVRVREFSGAVGARSILREAFREPAPAVRPDPLRTLDRTAPGAVLVMLGDLWTEEPEPLFRRAAARSSRCLAVHTLSPEELDPKLAGKLRLVDAETDEVRELYVDHAAREAYREKLRNFLGTLDRLSRECAVGLVRLSTALPVEEAFLRIVREGGIVEMV